MRIPKDEYSEILTPQEALAAQLALKDMTKEEKILYLALLEKKEDRAELKFAQKNPIAFAQSRPQQKDYYGYAHGRIVRGFWTKGA